MHSSLSLPIILATLSTLPSLAHRNPLPITPDYDALATAAAAADKSSLASQAALSTYTSEQVVVQSSYTFINVATTEVIPGTTIIMSDVLLRLSSAGKAIGIGVLITESRNFTAVTQIVTPTTYGGSGSDLDVDWGAYTMLRQSGNKIVRLLVYQRIFRIVDVFDSTA